MRAFLGHNHFYEMTSALNQTLLANQDTLPHTLGVSTGKLQEKQELCFQSVSVSLILEDRLL